MGFTDRLQHAWNAFIGRDPTWRKADIGAGYSFRPDHTRLTRGNARSIISSVYNRIAVDAASINIEHARIDANGHYTEILPTGINNCLTLSANLDQTSRAFMEDAVLSLLDEGTIAIVPVDTTVNPIASNSYDILSMRVGKIIEWYPEHVKVRLYNEKTGQKEDVTVPKRTTAIVENPFYSIMNEPNATAQRLIRKLNMLDAVDEQSSSGKLDLIIQLPYVIKSEARRQIGRAHV